MEKYLEDYKKKYIGKKVYNRYMEKSGIIVNFEYKTKCFNLCDGSDTVLYVTVKCGRNTYKRDWNDFCQTSLGWKIID